MVPAMRSTVRIDDDLMSALKARAHAEHVSLTRMLNRVLRRGLTQADATTTAQPEYLQMTSDMGEPTINLDKALGVAALLEDEETIRKLELRK